MNEKLIFATYSNQQVKNGQHRDEGSVFQVIHMRKQGRRENNTDCQHDKKTSSLYSNKPEDKCNTDKPIQNTSRVSNITNEILHSIVTFISGNNGITEKSAHTVQHLNYVNCSSGPTTPKRFAHFSVRVASSIIENLREHITSNSRND